MTADIIDGKAFAANLRGNIQKAVASVTDKTGKKPGLAVILVGEDPASEIYVRNKNKATIACGMESFEHIMPATTSQKELIAKIKELNEDDNVHGILVQLPVPEHIDTNTIIETISPEKDVDGFHPINTGNMWRGQEAMVPCTPFGCRMLIEDRLGWDLSGLNAVVIGRSNIVGKPMASLLLERNASVMMVHSRTKNIAEIVKQADIVVAAVGKPKMVKADWIKQGATVIDVGINRIEVDGKNRLVGDVDFDEVKEVAGAITPVPKGVGPMTIACLLRNTLLAFCNKHQIDMPKLEG